MEKVFVTGGAGFIGSHLCDALIAKGYQVICLDNLLTGSEKNIQHLLTNPSFKFIKKDIIQPIDYQLSANNYIFHLASPASPADFQKYPEEIALVNTVGTLNILKLAVKTKGKVLIASTSEVYGDSKEHPQKETHWGYTNSFGPRSCYDEGKRFAETLAYIYLHKHGVDVRLVRIFNTFGPRMRKDDGRVVSNFINQAIEGRPITIYGEGNHTRSFCYVSDLVEGILKAMFTKETKGEIFNLGNPEEYRIIDLASEIKEMAGSASEIVYKSLPPDDPMQRRPDIAKAKKVLDWEPKVPVREGLQKTIEYYKNS